MRQRLRHPTALAPPELPVLSPELHARYFLSPYPCPRNHHYQDTGLCLRRRGNHGCQTCYASYPRRRGGVAPRQGTGKALPLTRPTLPLHLRETCFLSPIRCDIAAHVWRNTAYCLRFVETETCCQCVAARTTLDGTARAQAGD